LSLNKQRAFLLGNALFVFDPEMEIEILGILCLDQQEGILL